MPFELPLFYHQVFYVWFELKLYDQQINNVWDIRRQPLWYNKDITIDNKYVFENYRILYKHGITIIHDIIDEKGNFLADNVLEQKTESKTNFLIYYSLKDAIPMEWRKKLKTSVVSRDAISSEELPSLSIKTNIKIPITVVSNRDVYWMLTKRKQIEPTCKLTWNLTFKVENRWSTIFTLPFKTVRETRIQSFQYKILNRIFPCNYYLAKFKQEISCNCEYCKDNVDTIEHYFYYCRNVREFWTSFSKWFSNIIEDNVILEIEDIIFGFFKETSFKHVLNYCIYYGKWHIYRQKTIGKELFLYSFLVELKHKL